MRSYLEPDIAPLYLEWQREPSKENTERLLEGLKPTMSKAIYAHLGAASDTPVVRGYAKRLTLAALKNYDPRMAGLKTHVINYLQGLKRMSRRGQQVLRVPEAAALDHRYLQEQQAALSDKLGRDPSLQELSDATGLSIKRIQRLQRLASAVPESSFTRRVDEEGEAGDFMPAVVQGPRPIILEAVYGDLDGVNQKIMEWSLGLHGQPRLSNTEIARKLRLTPSAVSQRKAVIQRRIQAISELNLF